ncbi:MAG: phenylalanine--tRNA ligase subunit alpha [Patescibacteria group bacterium]|nr:phenylalanine--tRNA ligase subunit alpha [Patescibacteria group bacterium]
MIVPETILTAARQDLAAVKGISQLEEIETKYLGRNGKVNSLFKNMKKLAEEASKDVKEIGKELNRLKQELERLITEKKELLLADGGTGPDIDLTLPGIRPRIGKLHPHTLVRRQMNDIFKGMGFSVYEGPHIETDEYVFERANLPKNHPARSLQDTIIIENPDILLRSHTSSVQSRAMENLELPIRLVVPGFAFRYETPNQTNHFIFLQYEGIAVAEDLTMADLHGALETFCKMFFGRDTKVRIRCKYYPQVEPGCGLDIQCKFCGGKGCAVCKRRGWVEIAGAGMVHANMLRMNGIDPSRYSGFAWGMGFDRIVMQKLNIDDIRKLYNGALI